MSREDVSVSIVIPTFNRPELLQRAVLSAIAALPEDGEIIVTDDRSERPAADILARFASRRLKVTVNQGTPGAAGNRNHGVSQAQGKLIFFLDDDDLLKEGYPRAVLEWWENGATECWGFSATQTHLSPDLAPGPFLGTARMFSVADMPFRKRLGGLGCGFWIRRETLMSLGGIDETLRVNEDTEFSIRLHASGYEPAFSPEPGVSILQHEGTRLTSSSSASLRAKCFRAVIDKHREYLTSHPDAYRHLVRRMLKMQAKNLDAADGIRSAMSEGTTGMKPGNLAFLLLNLSLEGIKGRRTDV